MSHCRELVGDLLQTLLNQTVVDVRSNFRDEGIRVRQATNNRKGLPEALRAINLAGGNISVEWPLAKALEVADRALGVLVLSYRDGPNIVCRESGKTVGPTWRCVQRLENYFFKRYDGRHTASDPWGGASLIILGRQGAERFALPLLAGSGGLATLAGRARATSTAVRTHRSSADSASIPAAAT